MFVCHCNTIHCHGIRDAVADMRSNDPYCIVTPAQVFKAHGCRPKCGNCMPLFAAVVAEAIEGIGGQTPSVRTRVFDGSTLSSVDIAPAQDFPQSILAANSPVAEETQSTGEEGHERQQGRHRRA